jgi:hypothetical protein
MDGRYSALRAEFARSRRKTVSQTDNAHSVPLHRRTFLVSTTGAARDVPADLDLGRQKIIVGETLG